MNEDKVDLLCEYFTGTWNNGKLVRNHCSHKDSKTKSVTQQSVQNR